MKRRFPAKPVGEKHQQGLNESSGYSAIYAFVGVFTNEFFDALPAGYCNLQALCILQFLLPIVNEIIYEKERFNSHLDRMVPIAAGAVFFWRFTG